MAAIFYFVFFFFFVQDNSWNSCNAFIVTGIKLTDENKRKSQCSSKACHWSVWCHFIHLLLSCVSHICQSSAALSENWPSALFFFFLFSACAIFPRPSLHSSVQTKLPGKYDALRTPTQRNKCLENPTMAMCVIFRALGCTFVRVAPLIKRSCLVPIMLRCQGESSW